MKKILLLGGSFHQIIAIKEAKKLGYYTILCDYLKDNPGQYYADKFYLESTTNKNKILEIALNEEINGIIAYASDPAAPTAAYVAEKMHLPTNSFQSVSILCDKSKFRKFLDSNGFNSPKFVSDLIINDNCDCLKSLTYPVIVKPIDSSGSKGVTVINSKYELQDAIKFAKSYSKKGSYIIEEYIEKGYPFVIGGDLLVVNGMIKVFGLMNCLRDSRVNTLVPVGKCFPLSIDKCLENEIHYTLQRIITLLNFKQGAFNVELIIDKNKKIWPIDMGPRCGGNQIPQFLDMIYNINIVKSLLKMAMGETVEVKPHLRKGYFATHNIHSTKRGILRRICFNSEIEKYILKKDIYVKEGETIEPFKNASKVLGIVFFQFNTREEMDYYLYNIYDYISIDIQ